MSTRPTLSDAAATGRPIVLDGGLATLLERHGHDLRSALWSAQLLATAPEAVVAAHAEYFAAGADVATTASYQASFDGFARVGVDRAAAAELMRDSCRMADRARRDHEDRTGERAWVAASVGPYGAALADGSEYRGDDGLSVTALRDWHRERLQLLGQSVEGGVADLLAVETIPSMREVEAVLLELAGSGVPAWLSVTATVADGLPVTRAGEPLVAVARAAADVDEIVAVGVNCVDPTEVVPMLDSLAAAGLPLLCYPNSGERWDADRRRWTGPATIDGSAVESWAEAGASLVGGCCRVGPELIGRIRESVGWGGLAGARHTGPTLRQHFSDGHEGMTK